MLSTQIIPERIDGTTRMRITPPPTPPLFLGKLSIPVFLVGGGGHQRFIRVDDFGGEFTVSSRNMLRRFNLVPVGD